MTEIIKVPDVPAPTAVLCWKQNARMVRCDRKAGHGGLHSWERAEALATENGAVVLSAEDARGLAFLLARAIHEDGEASDWDRREARKLLAKLGGDTQ
jgi:hypothetical protein